jgi:hypothetical protein
MTTEKKDKFELERLIHGQIENMIFDLKDENLREQDIIIRISTIRTFQKMITEIEALEEVEKMIDEVINSKTLFLSYDYRTTINVCEYFKQSLKELKEKK